MKEGLTEVDFLTVAELATRLRVRTSWVYKHAGDLGAYRLGKYIRFSWERVLDRLDKAAGAAHTLGPQPNDPHKQP